MRGDAGGGQMVPKGCALPNGAAIIPAYRKRGLSSRSRRLNIQGPSNHFSEAPPQQLVRKSDAVWEPLPERGFPLDYQDDHIRSCLYSRPRCFEQAEPAHCCQADPGLRRDWVAGRDCLAIWSPLTLLRNDRK